jgi:ribosomal protein S18 acetylase RimI-like enzyme
MLIRNFRKSDLDRILGFKCESVKTSFPACEFDDTNFRKNVLKAPTGSILIAEADGVIAGYIYLKIKKTSIGTYGMVHHIFVDPEHRGEGIASALMGKAEDYFRAQDIKKIRVTITMTNKPSLELARKFGYKEKRIVMEKELK